MAQFDPDLFRRMQEAALRFRSGESDFEEIMTPNGPARLVRDAASPLGFRIEFVGAGARHSVQIQEYPPSTGRPHGYPAPLPFLPDCVATINTLDQAVTWSDLSDPASAAEEVGRQCVEDGWAADEQAPLNSEEEYARTFTKDGVVRTLRVVRDDEIVKLTLSERRIPH